MGIGEPSVEAVASAFCAEAGLCAPLHPLIIARLSGLWLLPKPGERARVEGCQLRYDDALDGWREAVSAVACGRLLRMAGVVDCHESRCLLATALGTSVPAPECWGDTYTAHC
jgi:hypothetical protein